MITAVMLIMRQVLGIATFRTNDRLEALWGLRDCPGQSINEPEKAVNRLTARQFQTHVLFEQRDRSTKVAVS